MLNKLKSRKLWATVVGGVILTLSEALGIDPETSKWLVGLISSYVVGQGIADAGAAGKSQSSE